jgi:hypothetical protein
MIKGVVSIAFAGWLLLYMTAHGLLIKTEPLPASGTACTYFTGIGLATVLLPHGGACRRLHSFRT